MEMRGFCVYLLVGGGARALTQRLFAAAADCLGPHCCHPPLPAAQLQDLGDGELEAVE